MVIPATARHWYSEDTGEEQRCDACGRNGSGSFHRLTADPAGQVVIEGIAMDNLTVLVVCDMCWTRHQRRQVERLSGADTLPVGLLSRPV